LRFALWKQLQCKWDSVLPFDKLWKEYKRIVKPNGAIVLFGRKGKMRKRGGYKKSNNIMGKMQEGFENYSDEYFPTNIIEFTNPRSNKLHPTEKPIEIIKMLIKHLHQRRRHEF
jgi:hypothetical protein